MHKFMNTAWGSAVKIAANAVIPLAIACAGKTGDLFGCIRDEWYAWTTAAGIALLTWSYNYLNPNDKRYGRRTDADGE